MHHLTVDEDQCALCHWNRCEAGRWIVGHWSIVDDQFIGLRVGISNVSKKIISKVNHLITKTHPNQPPVNATLVRTLDELQAAILSRGIFQRNPKSDSRFRFGVQIRRVLVGRYLSADAGILVDVHALRNGRSTETDLPADLLDAIAERDRLEGG